MFRPRFDTLRRYYIVGFLVGQLIYTFTFPLVTSKNRIILEIPVCHLIEWLLSYQFVYFFTVRNYLDSNNLKHRKVFNQSYINKLFYFKSSFPYIIFQQTTLTAPHIRQMCNRKSLKHIQGRNYMFRYKYNYLQEFKTLWKITMYIFYFADIFSNVVCCRYVSRPLKY